MCLVCTVYNKASFLPKKIAPLHHSLNENKTDYSEHHNKQQIVQYLDDLHTVEWLPCRTPSNIRVIIMMQNNYIYIPSSHVPWGDLCSAKTSFSTKIYFLIKHRVVNDKYNYLTRESQESMILTILNSDLDQSLILFVNTQKVGQLVISWKKKFLISSMQRCPSLEPSVLFIGLLVGFLKESWLNLDEWSFNELIKAAINWTSFKSRHQTKLPITVEPLKSVLRLTIYRSWNCDNQKLDGFAGGSFFLSNYLISHTRVQWMATQKQTKWFPSHKRVCRSHNLTIYRWSATY